MEQESHISETVPIVLFLVAIFFAKLQAKSAILLYEALGTNLVVGALIDEFV